MMRKCSDQFRECKGYEDSTIKYIASCKTGENSLKSTLSSLFSAQNKITNVLSKNSAVASSSSSRQLSTIVNITYTTITVNTSDTSAYTNASSFMNAIAMFTDVAQNLDADAIGTDSRIRLINIKNIINSPFDFSIKLNFPLATLPLRSLPPTPSASPLPALRSASR